MKTEKKYTKVKDLKIGDQIPNIGTVRSVIPAKGGNVHIVVEMLPNLATHTWDPEGETEILAPAAPDEDEAKVGAAWWIVTDALGGTVDMENDTSARRYPTLDDALVAAHRSASHTLNENFYIYKLQSMVYAHPGRPIVEREDFS